MSFTKHQSAQNIRLWPVLFFIAVCFSLYSIYLALISTFYINTYCIMCLVNYGINFSLLFLCWLIRKRFQGPRLLLGIKEDIRFLWGMKKHSVPIIVGFTIILIGVSALFPHYWKAPPPLVSPLVKTGLTADGHPWIGAADPEITITEFTDYQCFQCNKVHYYLRRIIAENPDRIRLVHRHFPMDHRVNPLVKQPYHMRAGPLALMAIYATEKNLFWPMNDHLFVIARGKQTIRLEQVAQVVGLDTEALKQGLNDPAIRKKLSKDIIEGIRAGITGTPGFIIDGQAYNAMLPPEIIKKLLQ